MKRNREKSTIRWQATNVDCEKAEAYAKAVVTYLALAVDKEADYGSSLCTWVGTLMVSWASTFRPSSNCYGLGLRGV